MRRVCIIDTSTLLGLRASLVDARFHRRRVLRLSRRPCQLAESLELIVARLERALSELEPRPPRASP